MGSVAGSGQYGYGLAKSKQGYLAKVPLLEGAKQKLFSSIEAAKGWQLGMAISEWGLARWELLKKGRLCVLRRFGCGVSVRPAISRTKLAAGGVAEYRQYGVFWYDHDGVAKSKFFSHSRYGDNAELEANWFAAKQRAKLTGSELNLPPHWTAESFDISESVKINIK